MFTKNVVSFLLVKNNKFLAEKRKLTKKYMPGAIVIPVGTVEPDEKIEAALVREIKEELNLTKIKYRFLATLKEKYTDHIGTIHYFLVSEWEGKIETLEAEKLIWIDLKDFKKLALIVDQTAILEYYRTKDFEL